MLSRRALLAVGVALPAGGLWPAVAVAAPVRPEIRPRAAWATGCPVKGPLEPEDVKFLLVHHTMTPNTDTAAAIPGRLRSVYGFHTRTRGWNDIAYNFLVDAYGVIWEGRQGSIAGPVRGDASGGSQGFAQLACFIGDFNRVVPTPAAMTAMTTLLAWLAARSGLSLAEEVTFVSRGSSRWRTGVSVTTPQIAAHRDMSQTDCPGDASYPLVASRLLPDARALLGAATPAVSATPVPDAATPTPSGGASGEPTASASAVPPAMPDAAPDPTAAWPALAGLGGAVAVGGIAWAAFRQRRGADAAAQDVTASEEDAWSAEQQRESDAAHDQGAEEPGQEPDERP